MNTTRLKQLPPSVVDEYVSMQLKSYHVDQDELSSREMQTSRVEYRLVKKKKHAKQRIPPVDLRASPSSLRYQSPIPDTTHRRTGQVILKPIEQNSAGERIAQEQSLPDRKIVKTPELIKLSVQRLGSVESVMHPVRGTTEHETASRDQETIVDSTRTISQAQHEQIKQTSVSHKFVCPHCKKTINKDLFITVTDEDGFQFQIIPKAHHRSSSSMTAGTQTDSEEKQSNIEEKSVEDSNARLAQVEGDVDGKSRTFLGETDQESDRKSASSKINTYEKEENVTFIKKSPEPVLDDDEPIVPLEAKAKDLKIVDECRKLVIAAEADGSTEAIYSAIRQLAVIAQQQLGTAANGKLTQSMDQGRLVCTLIGNVLIEEEFYPRLYAALNGLLTGWEFFSNEENYHLTFNLFTDLTSFLQSSFLLAQSFLANTKLISQILTILNYKKYISQLTQKNIWRFFEACLSLLCHLARYPVLDEYRSEEIAVARKFLSTGDHGYAGLWLPSTVLMSRIASPEEMAKSVKGNLADFIPPITGYIESYFSDKNGGGDDTSRSIRFSSMGDDGDQQKPQQAVQLMPVGAAVQLVELVPAFVKYLEVIRDRVKSSDKDFAVAQTEFNELLKCSVFLIQLSRPTQQKKPSYELTELSLAEWRYLVHCGFSIAEISLDLKTILRLTFGDKDGLREEVIKALKNFISSDYREKTLKSEAKDLLDKYELVRRPTPAPRSVTETIEQAKTKEDVEEDPNDRLEELQNFKSDNQLNDGASSVAQYSTNEALWNSNLVTWQNAQVRSWIKSIGLGKFEDEFEDYDGPMLLALYDVRRESPQYFQKEIAAKFGNNFNNLVRFTAELTKLVTSNQLAPTTSALNGDTLSMAISTA